MAEEKRGRKRERGEGREGGGNYLLASFSLFPLSTLLSSAVFLFSIGENCASTQKELHLQGCSLLRNLHLTRLSLSLVDVHCTQVSISSPYTL